MRIAVTGGTGFVGGRLVGHLEANGHEVVVIGRRSGVDVTDAAALDAALQGCEAVVHCAGINRQIGQQTFERVHVLGTAAVVAAARRAGVQRVSILSFLRARPDGPTAYHRSKWAAEELVRTSGLSWTVLKAGVIHGRGDHLLDHVSKALHSFPVFAFVGRVDRPVRPVAVDDVVRILAAAATGDARLADRTIAVLGPEELTLGAAVRRVAATVGRPRPMVALPVAVHVVLARIAERLMWEPLVAVAQVRILAEGITVAAPAAEDPPSDLRPETPFSAEVIRRGLPPSGGFGRHDLRCWGCGGSEGWRKPRLRA